MSITNVLRLIKMDCSSKASRYLLFLVFGIGLLIFYFFNYDFSLLSIVDNVSGRSLNNYQNFINNQNLSTSKFHLTWFPKVFLLIATMITSISFSEYSMKESKIFHLTIPSKPAEKWFAKLIIALLLFPVIFLFIYQAFALLTYQWDKSLPFHIVSLHITDPFIWKHTFQIIAIQGIVFLGAVSFRKYSFFKTVLAIGVITVLVNIVLMISITILREDINLFTEGGLAGLTSIDNAIYMSGFKLQNAERVDIYGHYGFTPSTILYLISIICVLLSFLKFKELEA